NGDDAPGTVLHRCSHEFRKIFAAADLIIAKGQGNYETLSDHPANIFFLLKAKCPVVAQHIGCEVGDALLYHPRKN
ncbi:MAG: ARMT1-like domain-containing protein, partial [Desulfuromonas sp.]